MLVAGAALAAPVAMAAHTWTGAADGDIDNKDNYSQLTWSCYFNSNNLTGNKVKDIYLSKDLSGKVTLTTHAANYRGLFFQKGSWTFTGEHGGTLYKFDNSGGSDSSNDKDKIAIAASNIGSKTAGDARARIHCADIKTKYLFVGCTNTVSMTRGTLILDDKDVDGATYHGPVTFETTSDLQLYNGRIESTAATVTVGGIINMGYSDNASAELVINSGTWKAQRLWMSRNNNNVSKLYVKGGLLQMTGSGDNGRITVGTTSGTSVNYVEISGGTVDCSSGTAFRLGGDGNADAWSEMLLSGGTVKCRDFYVGDASSARLTMTGGTLDASSGWVYFAFGSGCAADESCELNLDGGTIVTKKFMYYNGAAPASLNLNGGTIKAASGSAGAEFLNDYANLAVNVGAGGAKFDTNGKAIVVREPLDAVSGTAGDLTVSGGGTATFGAMGDIAGAFTVGENTTLHWFDQDGVVADYTVSAINLAPGATLVLDADTTGCDTFAAAATNITATAENPAVFKLIVRAMPPPGTVLALFAMDEADTNKVNVVAETPAGGSLIVERGYADGGVTFAIDAKDYVWNGTQPDWGDEGAWDVDGVATTWTDNNNAVFNTPDAAVSLAAGATAVRLDFLADATISTNGTGEATLTVPEVRVAPSVAATISVPTAGALAKDGAGTLTLTQSRTERTVLNEGMLAMADGATVDGTKLTLGMDAARPVVFDYGGQSMTNVAPTKYLVPGADVTLANGTFESADGHAVDHGTLPAVLTIARDATFQCKNFSINTLADATHTLNIAGGTYVMTNQASHWIMQKSFEGRLDINLTDGALMEFANEVYVLTCRDEVNNSTVYLNPSVHWTMNDSTLRVKNGKSIRFGRDDNNKNAVCPTLVFAATNSVIDLGYGMYIGNNAVGENTDGSYTADFENCTITGRQIVVYQDRPQNAVRFNNTRLVLNAASNYTLETAEAFETMGEDGTAIKPMAIDAGGLVLDANGNNCQLRADPQGAGAFTKTGAGTLTVKRNQTATSPFVCDAGETAVAAGIAVARPVTVRDGATFTAKAAKTVSLADLSLEAGARLHIDQYEAGVTPLKIESGLALPEDGAATLSKADGWATGKYRILEKAGVAVADVQDRLVPTTDDGLEFEYAWCVDGDVLFLTVGTPSAFFWTGLAGDGRMSTAGNWFANAVPGAGDALDFSGVTAATAIEGDVDATFGAVTMGAGVITFTGDRMAATTFSDTSKVAVGANSTVTLDGDLTFDGSNGTVIVNKVDADGAFIVTGTVKATVAQNISPVAAAGSGCIVVNGVEIPAGKSLYSTKDVTTQKWAIGPGGVTAGTGGTIWCLSNSANDCWIYPYTNDFTVSAWTVVREAIDHHELNTTGWGDGLPHTITLDAGFADKGALFIAGTGKVVVNHEPFEGKVGGYPAYSGNVTVTNTATLAINAGMKLTTGKITFAAGTTLEVPSSGVEMGAIAFSGEGTVTLKVTGGPLMYGRYPLVTSTSDLPANVLPRLVLDASGVADEDYAWLEVSGDCRSLVLAVGDRASCEYGVWVGGEGNLRDAANWRNGLVPRADDTLDFSGLAVAKTINCGDWGGTAFAGVKLGTAARQITVSGTLRLAALSATTTNCNLSVGTNSKLIIDGDATLSSSPSNVVYIVYENKGAVEIGGKVVVRGNVKAYPCYNCAAAATIAVKGIDSGASGSGSDFMKLNAYKKDAPTVKWIVGEGGLGGSKGYWIDRGDGDNKKGTGAELKAAADFAINLAIGARQILTLDTGDGKTITVNGEIYMDPASDTVNTLTVKGSGTVVCNYVQNNKSKFNGEVVVKDTATLAVNAGKCVTTGRITVNAGATLEVAQSGTVELDGVLTLKDGARLKFDFTQRRVCPVLDGFGADFRFGSYNIRCENSSDTGDKSWDSRKGAVASFIKGLDCDIIGFQEVKESQKTYLGNNLSGYTFAAGKISGSSEYVSVAYKTDRFERLDGNTFWLSDTPSRQSKFDDSQYYRICTWLLLKDKATSAKVLFASTHLDLKDVRTKQMKVILDFAAPYLADGVPVIVVGDMNENENNPAMMEAVKVFKDSAVEARSVSGPWRTYNGWNYKDPDSEPTTEYALTLPVSSRNPLSGGKRIDFVFVPRTARVESYVVRNDTQSGKKVYPSDHYAVYSDLTLPARVIVFEGRADVEVSAACPNVVSGRHVLTLGARLASGANLDFVLPDWVERADVEDGEIVIYSKTSPFQLKIR